MKDFGDIEKSRLFLARGKTQDQTQRPRCNYLARGGHKGVCLGLRLGVALFRTTHFFTLRRCCVNDAENLRAGFFRSSLGWNTRFYEGEGPKFYELRIVQNSKINKFKDDRAEKILEAEK